MKKDDRFKSFVAVLVAMVTVLGAMAACLATVAGSGASDADFNGVSAAIKAQKAEVVNDVTAYEHYRAYTAYVRYDEMGNLIYDETVNSNENEAQDLTNQRMEAWGLADALRIWFFPPRYIDPDTRRYNLRRELDELWAADAQADDLNAGPHFAQADRLRRRSLFLTADMIVFAIAFWFLTLSQIFENRAKYFGLVFGVLMALAATLGILIVEFVL
jgi:hypothetical protein